MEQEQEQEVGEAGHTGAKKGLRVGAVEPVCELKGRQLCQGPGEYRSRARGH